MNNSKLLVLLLVFCVSSVLALPTQDKKNEKNEKAGAVLNRIEASRETNSVFSATSDVTKISIDQGELKVETSETSSTDIDEDYSTDEEEGGEEGEEGEDEEVSSEGHGLENLEEHQEEHKEGHEEEHEEEHAQEHEEGNEEVESAEGVKDEKEIEKFLFNLEHGVAEKEKEKVQNNEKIQKLSGKIAFKLPKRKDESGKKGGDDFDGDYGGDVGDGGDGSDGGDDFDFGGDDFGFDFGDDSFGDEGFGDEGFGEDEFEKGEKKSDKGKKGRNQKDKNVKEGKVKGGKKKDDEEETESHDDADEEDPFAVDINELDEFGLLEGDDSGEDEEKDSKKSKEGKGKQGRKQKDRNDGEDEDVGKSSKSRSSKSKSSRKPSDDDNESDGSGQGGKFKIKITPKLAELRRKAKDKTPEEENKPRSANIHWFQSSNTYAFKCKFSSANLREMRNIQDELSCGQQCDLTQRCTHFTLLDNVCRLHAGPIEESKALEDPKSSCGFASIKDENWKPLGDNSVSLAAKACDFLTKDAKKVDAKTDKDCANACAKEWPECTHFTFAKNVCHLKKANLVVKMSAFASYDDTATCGILTRMLPRDNKA